MVLKDLVKNEQEVVISLSEENREKFLKQAKKEGFKWLNGDEIQNDDKCFFHVSISQTGRIANISAMCYAKSKKLRALPRYEY